MRAFLHRLGGSLIVNVTLLLVAAAHGSVVGHANVHHFATDLAAAERGLGQMSADAALLQRRLAQAQAEVTM